MTSVVDIIYEGFRECSLISELGHPTPSQFTQALGFLQNMISDVAEFETGEPLVDYEDCNWYNLFEDFATGDLEPTIRPQANIRILISERTPDTIYLPTNARHGARIRVIDPEARLASAPLVLDANGGTIESTTSVTLNTNSLNRTWIYSRDTANWARVEAIDEDSEMPFESRFDDYFVVSLAARLSPRYRREITSESQTMLSRARSHMRSYYRQERQMPAELGLLPWWGFDYWRL